MKKTNVTLRKKVLADGRISLYLDFYPPILDTETNRQTRREFLKLYLFEKPKNQIQKISNMESLQTAELIQIRRQNELRKHDVYSTFEKEQLELQRIGKGSFMKYFNDLAALKVGKNYLIWRTAIAHFENFLNGNDVSFKDVTVTLVNDYKEYLLKAKSRRETGNAIARNSALSYYNKLKTTLKRAYKEGKLRTDINAGIDSIKESETQRNFLTLNEAKRLFKTSCSNQIVYRISMFSTLTGLRYSDIAKLTWSEIEFIEEDGYYIRFKQKKTEGLQTMPISEEAYQLLGKSGNEDEKVFLGLKKWDVDRVLPVWLAHANIKKHITFHCFRHTYATLQIFSGTDIFTVSKMLGHKSVKTTQIYTKIIDEKKREASMRISLK
ncbi:Site-specific recombinase XerD [Flavobacterium resistens]|uniref:Site-specific recombinase XerD n=1 Tax=Flavobacterium resistens TaxID=443612 RepID=A0A521F7G4_9FLAO|nr:site-specific integrase [Flavobacterium resistens]MRX70127.1 tyrosine-type recombinase/integrase [Flavobacterium resistens]SMO92077.1 Site-specific recombinase XerD [Flavobacterium resistens]